MLGGCRRPAGKKKNAAGKCHAEETNKSFLIFKDRKHQGSVPVNRDRTHAVRRMRFALGKREGAD
jgi:hypothetical protein